MKDGKLFFIISLFLLLITLSNNCTLTNEPEFKDQVLQGEILHSEYVFQSGYATTNLYDSTLWEINLLNKSPQDDLQPWEDGAYDGYPDLIGVWFSIKKPASQKYMRSSH